MNFGGLLSIGRSGLNAAQAQISTASQNVTNAQTPGYSRQKVTLTPNYPEQLPFGTFGTGVLVNNVMRDRDELLDSAYRADTASASLAEQKRDALTAVESVMGEPSNTGLASSLDQFWSSWSDLSTNPNSSAAKAVVRQRGTQVATQLNMFGNQIVDAQTTARAQLLQTADRVNLLSQQVADINTRIVAAEAAGNQSPDLRDQRDLKIDELASLIGATSYPQPNGAVNVNVGGDSLVDGANYKSVRVQALKTDPLKLGLALGPAPSPGVLTETMYQLGGQVAGTIDAYNNTFPSALASLDGVASALATATNAVHSTGFLGATPAGNFFDATRLTARTIRLESTIAADANNIASSGVVNANGDNTVALALTQLRDTPVSVNGVTVSISEGYRNVVTSNATQVNGATNTATAARTLTTLTDTRRESVKGVSVDEEMVNLMKFQQAYSAAARLITVVDSMTQTWLSMAR